MIHNTAFLDQKHLVDNSNVVPYEDYVKMKKPVMIPSRKATICATELVHVQRKEHPIIKSEISS